MSASPGRCLILYVLAGSLLSGAHGKWVEGHVDTKENWAFLSRFCFLSLEGQFEYLIEFERDMGMPNLLLYYDDESQWPSVYHSSMSCKEREAVLNKNGQNQIIKLSHWYPDTEYSGCIVSRANKELPASKSSTTTKPTTKKNIQTTKSHKLEPPLNTSYYDQFLKATTPNPKTTTVDINSSTWFELVPTGAINLSTVWPEDEWETINPNENDSPSENLEDVEILFDNTNSSGRKIKRSTMELYERYKRRRLSSVGEGGASTGRERLVVSCHNSRRFRSARERWWFIAISNCNSPKGLDVRYKFLMTNGPDGDFWHKHFSADEFYVLPILIAYTFAYVLLMVAVVMCSVELRSRHLLHSTYKLFLLSVVSQHTGVLVQTLAAIRYAVSGVVYMTARTAGQFLCGVSEMTFLLLLVLMAKGYTITRGRLKVGFTVKLTVFMCCYIVTYIVLFVYQAKMFDPGEVLYLYESPAGYGLIVLRVAAWAAFAYATFFTIRKYPDKNTFYCPFFICGTLWFYAGPLFILTANSYIDKWVRESVVIAVLLFITFTGHIMFLLLTLPVFANKNFPYHVRTTQIGIMEVTGNSSLDGFGANAYHPSNGVPQTVIIPLTRRTEELIGNMYSQYMASAPPLSLENETPKLNGYLKRTDSKRLQNSLTPQDSTETNTSDDITPQMVKDNDKIFTVENQMAKIGSLTREETSLKENSLTRDNQSMNMSKTYTDNIIKSTSLDGVEKQVLNIDIATRNDLPNVLRPRRNILEPIKKEDVPSWSLAKGPCVVAMQRKTNSVDNEEHPESPSGSLLLTNGKKVPPVRNGLRQTSGEISTIHEGHIQSYQNSVSKATLDLFNASK
ncbi:PREDICTED: transmembrane protein 145-like [Papilio polytes]|uniref:transmembrane protein 145-like n=1 Tax=Papilio polytes TaxID=76194 RepID=UPI000675CAE7|nr:PREDICTED: transmembrane protein 145-like [Papilio polytes]